MSFEKSERRWIVIVVLIASLLSTLIYARFQLVYSLYSGYLILQSFFNL